VDLSRPRGGRDPFLHGAAAPTRLAAVALPPHLRCGHDTWCRCTRGAARMPTRRPSPTTDQAALSRAVAKKSTPVGRDCALVLPTASAQPLALSYWDLWFALVADADFDGSWERFVEYLRGQKNQGGSSRLAERKLSHLRDLERRLRQAKVEIRA